jgi:beta-glucosidase
MEKRIRELLSQMTLEEKVALTTGGGLFETTAVERLGIPSINMTDGPHGVRRSRPGSPNPFGDLLPATCFPTSAVLAASWDRELAREVGAAMGEECQALDIQVLLGPGLNMKRTPLCGRNFEYYAEDPLLAGEIGAAVVQGIQSRGVGATLKHFACNNQEYERYTVSAEVDERTLREIYLRAFERIVKQAEPWALMTAYNRINGVSCSEDPALLRGILREEWGFDGLVMSDWGAVSERSRALEAGLDLTMPGEGEQSNAELVRLVRDGLLAEEAVDEAAARVLTLVLKAAKGRRPGAAFDADRHHALARRAAAESMVLLKNDGGLLPLDGAGTVAIIGRLAREPRIQGAGSSYVNPTRIDAPFDELTRLLGPERLRYAPGVAETEAEDEALLAEAVAAARSSDAAVLCVGLPVEKESADRADIDLLPAYNRLVEEVCRVQPRTAVVVMSGSAVAMPWADRAAAILWAGLGGQAAGGAVADLLLGRANPSGRLAETFPVRLADTPAFLNYPGEAGRLRYGEGLFIGYRWYDARQVRPLFPFGHGLSYTNFSYESVALSTDRLTDRESLTVTVTLRNTGNRAGKEVVQLYVRDVESDELRPVRELKAFAKVLLGPGEVRQVELTLHGQEFAAYSPERGGWTVAPGEFELLAGSSSRETPLRATVRVETTSLPLPYSAETLLKQFLADPAALQRLTGLLGVDLSALHPMFLGFLREMPLWRAVRAASQGAVSRTQVEAAVAEVNRQRGA